MLTESFPKAREVMQAPTAMRDTTSSMLPTDSFSGFWRGGNKKRSFSTWVFRPKNIKFPAGNIKEILPWFYLASFHEMKWGIHLYRNCKICTATQFPEVEHPLRANGFTLVCFIIMIIIIIIILIAIIRNQAGLACPGSSFWPMTIGSTRRKRLTTTWLWAEYCIKQHCPWQEIQPKNQRTF